MSERFEFIETELDGLYVIKRKPIADDRGRFMRFFCEEEYKEIGFLSRNVQMNLPTTRNKGVVRGIHYQIPPMAETKIVTCLQGEILDVAVDLREGSPTFLRYYSQVLSKENGMSLFIPEGFGHGFQTLTEDCEVFYLHSEFYSPEYAQAVNAFDPAINIEWPLDVTMRSENDENVGLLNSEFIGVQV